MIQIREPEASEIERAAFLLGSDGHPSASWLVAVNDTPFRRLVGAANWWPDPPDGARVRLAAMPGSNPQKILSDLLLRVESSCAARGGRELRSDVQLPEQHPIAATLDSLGFTPAHPVHHYEASWELGQKRTIELWNRAKCKLPRRLRVESLAEEWVAPASKLARDHRLLDLETLARRLHTGTPESYDRQISGVLLEGDTLRGAALILATGDSLVWDARVVDVACPGGSGLGNLLLFHHVTEQTTGKGYRFHRFRAGRAEHIETANLAKRFGGRETGIFYTWIKPL